MNQFNTAIKLFLMMTLLTGVLYPCLLTLIGQIAMPQAANGSLTERDGKILGSALIGQNTRRDHYFWPRPSASNYAPLSPVTATHLGPTSKKLAALIKERQQKYGVDAPADLLYASASGLDPHISLEAALYQVPRVAKARSAEEEVITQVVHSLAQRRILGFFGPSYVNVLLLNLTLDEQTQ